jgi:hypothetical protein
LALCTEVESAALAAAADRCKRLKKIYHEEDKLAGAMDKQDEAASTILAASASIEKLQLKLSLFQNLWTRARGVEQPAGWR